MEFNFVNPHEMSKKDFDFQRKFNNWDVFTEKQVADYCVKLGKLIQKGIQSTLSSWEKENIRVGRVELKHLQPILVVDQVDGRLVKSLFYVQEAQVKVVDTLEKSFSGEPVQKVIFLDTPLNKELNRVGKEIIKGRTKQVDFDEDMFQAISDRKDFMKACEYIRKGMDDEEAKEELRKEYPDVTDEDYESFRKGYQYRNRRDVELDEGGDEDPDRLEKGGKRGQLGEIREWKGRKYKKTTQGWVPVPKGRTTGKSEESKTDTGEKKQEIRELANMARKGTLPPDFDRWNLKDRTGWTIARIAAAYGHLPKDFDQWSLRDETGWTVAHEAALHGTLPSDFDQWDLKDNNGETVAHRYAKMGLLPKNFDQWDLKNNDGETVEDVAREYGTLPKDYKETKKTGTGEGGSKKYGKEDVKELFKQVRKGDLPKDFKDWSLAGKDGWTVAHEFARFSRLPSDFNQWDMKDRNGNTVAHVAATGGHLPKDFDQWDMEDNFGWTVAHAAADSGHLPKDFDQWNLKDKKGRTVADVARESGHLPKDFPESDEEKSKQYNEQKVKELIKQVNRNDLPKDFDEWSISNKNGWSVAHEAAAVGNLPKDFTDWGIADKSGRTVAHVAAIHGNLPPNFDQWDLKDENGITVAHEAASYGTLPKDFKDWGLKDKKGRTVADVARKYGYLPKDYEG